MNAFMAKKCYVRMCIDILIYLGLGKLNMTKAWPDKVLIYVCT